MKIKILIYQNEIGKKPYSDWLNSIKDIQTRSRIRTFVDRLIAGNFSKCKSIGEGIHELKITIGPGFRIYFVNLNLSTILLITGGDKSTQEKDIKFAKHCYNDYKLRIK